MAVHLLVAGDVFDGVLFCAALSPTRCFGLDIGLLGIFLSSLSYTMLSKRIFRYNHSDSVASDQGLHYLLTGFSIKNRMKTTE